jgi:glycosyltransferase involved in cell wall biosynthesis
MTAPVFSDYRSYAERRDQEQPAAAQPIPSLSVVTVTLNAAATLERTIASVQQQTYPGIEQIFVDGGSTDGTIDIIRRLARPRDFWISEKDRGISDAFNKGIALSRGRFVQILNADDWLSPEQMEAGIGALEAAEADFVYGDLIFYENDLPTFTYVGDPDYVRVIHRRMPAISHPTVIARRACFEKIGLFDLAYRNAMDYDWFLRLHKAGGRGIYAKAVLGHMTHEGVSNRQFRRTIDEVRQIAVANGRNALLAAAEARMRLLKTSVSQPIKQNAKPLYQLIRSLANPAYRPQSADRA